jgi:hypothetical protein
VVAGHSGVGAGGGDEIATRSGSGVGAGGGAEIATRSGSGVGAGGGDAIASGSGVGAVPSHEKFGDDGSMPKDFVHLAPPAVQVVSLHL